MLTHKKNGFSMVELLTVIAIIAILAAIIFPAMNAVKAKARENSCMQQLHDIGLRIDMYKRDNNSYPDTIGPQVQMNGTDVVPMENASLGWPGSIFAKGYIDNYRIFHCPNSDIRDTTATITYNNGVKDVDVYAYDSYDCFAKAGPLAGARYKLRWATEEDLNSGRVSPENYQRQLIFRNPPSTTIITWCSTHSDKPEEDGASGLALVLYLDGHVEKRQAAEVRDLRWALPVSK